MCLMYLTYLYIYAHRKETNYKANEKTLTTGEFQIRVYRVICSTVIFVISVNLKLLPN